MEELETCLFVVYLEDFIYLYRIVSVCRNIQIKDQNFIIICCCKGPLFHLQYVLLPMVVVDY